MDTGSALGGAGLFISILGVIYSAINHKHIKTRCCGKVYEVSIDIGPNDSKESDDSKESAKVVPEAKPEAKPEPKVVPETKVELKNKFVVNKFVLPRFDP
jgi:hypothetical protein